MEPTKPKCGHVSLRSDCTDCDDFKRAWYRKIESVDKDWRDIEYGMEQTERLYEPVDLERVDPITTAFYDKVLEIFHRWVSAGRSKRDCFVAELYGRQEKGRATEREISAALKGRRLKPNSRWTVRKTIFEIKAVIIKAQPHQFVEQRKPALHPLESKPKKDETDGQTAAQSPGLRARATQKTAA